MNEIPVKEKVKYYDVILGFKIRTLVMFVCSHFLRRTSVHVDYMPRNLFYFCKYLLYYTVCSKSRPI